MKKLISMFIGMCLFLTIGIAFAGSPVGVPTVDGNDVLVPNSLIATVTDDPTNATVVAVFHDAVGVGAEVPMRFDGNNWVIPGGRGADVHPAVKTADGQYKWAKIENVWSTGSDFVKFRSPKKPCLHLE